MISAIVNQEYNVNFLNILNQKEKNTGESNFNYRIIRNDSNYSAKENRIVQWLIQSEFVSGLTFTILPGGKLFHKERLNLKFSLPEKYNRHFILLNSFFLFRKPTGLLISSDRADKSFTVDVVLDNEKSIIAYFETIFGWLSKEIKFKAVLKEVIRFEKRFNHEQALLVSALQSAIQ